MIWIQPSKVQDVLADSISTLSGVDYWTTGDVSSGIVLNDYDLSRGTGDKVHQEFVETYKEVNKEVENQAYLMNTSRINANKLIARYKKQKSNNEEELGGE